MTHSRRVAALSLALTILGTSTAMASTRAPAQAATFDAMAQLRDFGTVVLEQLLAVTPAGGTPIDDGPDNRLTVLLLGSDQRSGLPGERLDVIIVATYIASAPERVAFAGIPRDTVRFPRAASNGGGTSGGTKVNMMFSNYRTGSCNKDCALRKFRNDVETALHVDIDYYLYLKFASFNFLVDHVGGITVDSPGIIDKAYMDEPTLPKGIRFADALVTLRGTSAPYCKSWKASAAACRRAIVYVRSRKGTEGGHSNNDYRRSTRQQSVVFNGIRRVLLRGSGSNLTNLRNVITQMDTEANNAILATDVPLTSSAALNLYNRLNGASLGPRVVFKPPTYATASGATIRLKLDKVRAWVNNNLSAVAP